MTHSAYGLGMIYRHRAQIMAVVAVMWGCFAPGVSAQDQQIEADRFAELALACVHQEYPNHISHSLQSDADVAPPRELTPAFYGCLDWHSSVHGHWLLARLARQYPKSQYAQPARAALGAKPDGRQLTGRDYIRLSKGTPVIRATLWHRLVTAVGCGT